MHDESGAALPGATATLRSSALPGGPLIVVTSQQGEYRFTGLQPGTYVLRVELAGFTTRPRRPWAENLDRDGFIRRNQLQKRLRAFLREEGVLAALEPSDRDAGICNLGTRFLVVYFEAAEIAEGV